MQRRNIPWGAGCCGSGAAGGSGRLRWARGPAAPRARQWLRSAGRAFVSEGHQPFIKVPFNYHSIGASQTKKSENTSGKHHFLMGSCEPGGDDVPSGAKRGIFNDNYLIQPQDQLHRALRGTCLGSGTAGLRDPTAKGLRHREHSGVSAGSRAAAAAASDPVQCGKRW